LKIAVFIICLPFLYFRGIITRLRKETAIRKADKISSITGRKVYVSQAGRKFIVGNRNELREINKLGIKAVRKKYRSFNYGFDYRNSIIYSTKTLINDNCN
jgi:hypothetical protein